MPTKKLTKRQYIMKTRPLEIDICAEFLTRAKGLEGQYPFVKNLYHVPNEGKRAPWVAKKIGIRGGVLDYCLPVQVGLPTFYLEMKRPLEKPTKEQQAEMKLMHSLGHRVHWADNAEDAFNYLLEYCESISNDIKKNRIYTCNPGGRLFSFTHSPGGGE